MLKTERNQFVDIMRGIAMLLVVLGHTMTGCTSDAEKSVLINIVWSIQMPLFILITVTLTTIVIKMMKSNKIMFFILTGKRI